MKLSDRFNANSVACVVSLRELAESNEIDIPDVQRGLVWNPTQIANLWKSIFAGYPIGALTLYEQEGKWQLIDGQQRWHAIRLGLLKPDPDAELMTTLWVKNTDDLELMVCTRRHPWGFRWKDDELEKLPHGEMMSLWKEMMPQEMDSFALPGMNVAVAYCEKEGWIPLYLLLAQERPDSVTEVLWQKTEGWRARVNALSLPLIRFDLQRGIAPEKNRIHELFTRINKGGTPISDVDLTYSTLCSYMGHKFKSVINEIAKGFLPPNRVARLYARLAYAAVSPETLKGPDTPAFWKEHEYNAGISTAIGAARRLLEDAKVPASIHLAATSDEWLTVICWCMWKFRGLTGSATDKKLLCMLPYVVCRGPEFHKAFCKKFHEVLKVETSPCGILHLAAIGTAYAACYSQETGMYPLREPAENPSVQSSYDYDDEWLTACLNKDNKGLLHFIQSSYMNKLLLPECGFYPHEKATWGDAMNRPWDEDHIVPQSLWWRLEPDEFFFQECLANKQMLYYRHNRSKSNSRIEAPEGASKNPSADFCYPEAGFGEVNLYSPRPGALRIQRKIDASGRYAGYLSGYKSVVKQRFGTMVQKLWEELPLSALVEKINAFALSGTSVPPGLQPAVERWKILEGLKDKDWCALRHDSSRQQIISEKDFYHSLCSWLAVGVVENDAFRCFCWQQVDAHRLNIEGGLRRLPDQTVTEWMERAGEVPRSLWWIMDGSFKEGTYEYKPGSNLAPVVDSVKPHSRE